MRCANLPLFSFAAAVWIGGWSNRAHDLYNSTTGVRIRTIYPNPTISGGGYGCLVDGNNVLWGAGGYGYNEMFKYTDGGAMSAVGGLSRFVYGMGLDKSKVSPRYQCAVHSICRRRHVLIPSSS
jgi:hypothetical protein